MRGTVIARKEASQPIQLLSGILVIALVIIGLVALLEKGPVIIPLYVGAHPVNEGPLGTSELYKLLSKDRRVILVSNWERVAEQVDECSRGLIIIISPEIPYTQAEVSSIVKLRDECSELSLLIADETGHANLILESFGSRVNILGQIITDQYIPLFLETPWGWRGFLVLDKPSMLTLSNQSIDGIFYYYEELDELRIFTIGDGSIFLNQVLRSNFSEPYRSFIITAVEYFCGNDCVIFLEASKYQYLTVHEVFQALVKGDSDPLIGLIDPFNLILAIVTIAIHPSVWLPFIVSILNEAFGEISKHPLLQLLIPTIPFIILTVLLVSREERLRDSPLKDVVEIEWYGYASFRRLLEERGLTRDDFLQLYTIVDSVLKSTTGVGLDSPDAISILKSHGIDEKKAVEYVNFMNKYRDRALGKRWWPFIVLWSRVARKALVLSEDVLAKLGASLQELRGIEERPS